jgi:hypothetical protein
MYYNHNITKNGHEFHKWNTFNFSTQFLKVKKNLQYQKLKYLIKTSLDIDLHCHLEQT